MLPLWKRLKAEFLLESDHEMGRKLEKMSNEIASLRGDINELRKVLYVLSIPTEIERRGVLQLKGLKEELDKWGQTLSKLGKGQMEINITLESLSQLWEDISGEIEKGLSGITMLEKIINQLEVELRKEIRASFVKELFPLIQVLDGMEEALSYAGKWTTAPTPGNHHPRTLMAFIKKRSRGKSPETEMVSSDNYQWIEGLRITQRKLEEFLKNIGISSIEAVGRHFDSHQHQSVGVLETSEMQENLVVKEEIKGYRYGEHIIRYPQVIVSKRPVEDQVDS